MRFLFLDGVVRKMKSGMMERKAAVRMKRALKSQWFHTLKHTIQSQEQHFNMLQTLYTLEIDLSPE